MCRVFSFVEGFLSTQNSGRVGYPTSPKNKTSRLHSLPLLEASSTLCKRRLGSFLALCLSSNVHKQSEQRLPLVCHRRIGVVVAHARSGIIHSVNYDAQQLFGYRKDELVGQSINVLMPPEVAALHDNYLERFHLSGNRFMKTARRVIGVTKTGSRINVTVALSMIVESLLSALIQEGSFLSVPSKISPSLPTTQRSSILLRSPAIEKDAF